MQKRNIIIITIIMGSLLSGLLVICSWNPFIKPYLNYEAEIYTSKIVEQVFEEKSEQILEEHGERLLKLIIDKYGEEIIVQLMKNEAVQNELHDTTDQVIKNVIRKEVSTFVTADGQLDFMALVDFINRNSLTPESETETEQDTEPKPEEE